MSINRPYGSLSELPGEIPVFPLPGCLLLPRCDLPLNIFEPRYLEMIDAALRGARLVGMIQPRAETSGSAPELFNIGCVGRLTKFAETGDGRYVVTLTGVCRFQTGRETTASTPYRTFAVAFDRFADDLENAQESSVDRDAVLRALRAYADRNEIGVDWKAISDVSSEALVNSLAMMSPFGSREKQAFLEAPTLAARAKALVATTEIELAGLGPAGFRPN
jgi:Lon protease-like protein